MAKVKGCTVVGIERVEGTKKSGDAFAFWKIYCLAEDLQTDKFKGERAVSCIVNDEEMKEEDITLGSSVTLVKSGFDRFEFGYVES